MYWRPPATGPPTPSLNGGSIFASAPPSLSSITPVRRCATRRPRSAAAAASRSQATHDLGEEVRARRSGLVDALVAVRAVVADGRRGDQRARARLGGAESRDEVPRCRRPASRGCAAWRRRVQRWATFSPARWTTASRPASAVAGAGPSTGSHSRRCSTPGERDSTVTSSPRSRSAATSLPPIRPVAPVMVIFIAGDGRSGPADHRMRRGVVLDEAGDLLGLGHAGDLRLDGDRVRRRRRPRRG